MSQLAGKTAVVLGASGENNFGSATARRLAEAGANVVVASRRKEALEKLAGEMKQQGRLFVLLPRGYPLK